MKLGQAGNGGQGGEKREFVLFAVCSGYKSISDGKLIRVGDPAK